MNQLNKNKPKKSVIDSFVLMLLFAVLLAWLFPKFGVLQHPVSLGKITDFGIAGIFFFYGLRMNMKKIREGISNWKLHLTVQITTFILFPVLILSVMFFVPNVHTNLLWIGIFYVAALPSTVSSSVVMVSIARGNIPAAIFNASLSSILGVVVTPLWMRLFLSGTESNISDYNSIFIKLFFQIILPLIVGISLNRFLGKFAEKHSKMLRLFEQVIIAMIVYVAFSKSFSDGIFFDYGILTIFLVAMGMLTLFAIVYFLMILACKKMKFSIEDTITTTFCGSKKSLVHGSAMSKILFPNISAIGLVLMPVMMYHILQLIAVSMISNKLAKRSETDVRA